MFEVQTGELPRVEAAPTTRTWKSDEKGKHLDACGRFRATQRSSLSAHLSGQQRN